jgi:hypothetical protein
MLILKYHFKLPEQAGLLRGKLLNKIVGKTVHNILRAHFGMYLNISSSSQGMRLHRYY